MSRQSRGDALLEDHLGWLSNLEPMPVPIKRSPFVRTKYINKKTDGCYICGRKTKITKHHIKRGRSPLCVFVCWKHHQILHGIALQRFRSADLRMVLSVALRYGLFKEGEETMVQKRILIELDRRDINGDSS